MSKTELLQLQPPSRAAGSKLFLQSWMPETDPKGVILLAHGYAEHAGRYAYFAQKCVESGFAVYAIDHWGHGRSDGDRGYVPAFSVFLDGMAALLRHVKSLHPNLPRALVGHSMGGLIAGQHLLSHQSDYATAVLSGPVVAPAQPVPLATRLIGRALSVLIPKAGLLGLDPNGVSRDPEVVKDYLSDPLVYKGKISARLAAEMLDGMTNLTNLASTLTLPLMVVHGSLDSLAAPQGGQLLIELVSSTDKIFDLREGLYHEVFNEPERDAVIAAVITRIAQTIG